ncbi:MAG: hypothetical protein HY725_04560 [Candidatus Rokubacteria bacterium]|nr:hypothetical protein [Candidatus Rokubacteria bacterium]
MTHFLNGRGYGILDERGRIKPAVGEARRRGILFDVGHGRMHLNFGVAKADRAGVPPRYDLLRPDVRRRGGGGERPADDTLEILEPGNAARGRGAGCHGHPGAGDRPEGEVGTLRPGAVADVAVFELEEGECEFHDADGNSLPGRRRLTPSLTVKDGAIWWAISGMKAAVIRQHGS